ncbi:EF-hand domain-containing family member C2-like [Saccoglossus kowalevskii]|uniref:EF-hand domain-containing family member C2 n=1 Tax=Saccoglossus kowalevskii TaxID=10224 RepID=A0ABM0GRQ3_SACKO|nr:PREDICTED: EF-hand domain-containing family member C2-like [Saccoglossus kowalevskii]
MSLPFLPGNSFDRTLGKGKFHKSHHFDHCNDVSLLVGEHKPGIGGKRLLGQKSKPRHSNIPRGEGNAAPAWVAFDRQVLCFDAYFQEAVHEKREEQFRIRNCKIYFYLEDDSVQVTEPQVKNSGVPQGTLIRRHRIPLPPPNDDEFYTIENFNVGKEITLYSRTFKITNCDQFTYNFLRKLGVRVNLPEDTPSDPYTNHRKNMDETQQPLRPYEKVDTLKQFLDHDRHVLRFFCYWDDSDNMFGDSREMVLHYFLADDTIEIREVIPANSGRDAAPMFLRRARLPKTAPESLRQPGENTGRTVLNVFGPMGHGGRYILDSLKTGAVITDYYTDRDLQIGSIVNVWGRKFVLCDCDNFTKEYYRTKFGLTDFSALQYKGDKPGRYEKQWPPYNGFGSEEDSLCSCMGLLPKPPRRDFIKFMEKDRHGLDSNVLRFVARLDTTKPIDIDRRFIISYFLSDDSIAVFEPPQRNSGIIGGKFLERGRIKKPNQPRFSTKLSEYFMATDLYVGSRVDFNCHIFILTDADEYAYRYMEKHAQEFQVADINAILKRLKDVGQANVEQIADFFKRNDPDSLGKIRYEQFRTLLQQIASSRLTEHSIVTIARYFSDRQEDRIDITVLASIAQEQLRKNNFENFAKLIESFTHHDTDASGYIDPEQVRSVCHAFHVPLPDDLLRTIISRGEMNEQGQVNYSSFIKMLNWRENPITNVQYTQPPMTLDQSWSGNSPSEGVQFVNYVALMQELFGASRE